MPKRPCWAEISPHALQVNWSLLLQAANADSGLAADRTASPVELLAIVKADAYGHRLQFCAPAAVQAGARWLGVTSVEEGVEARRSLAGAEADILAIGGPFPGQGAAVIAERITAVVWERWQLDELASAARLAGCGPRSVPVHAELDTGMSRQGVGQRDLPGILAHLSEPSPLRLDGWMTHLYAADESDGEATRAQFDRLESMLAETAALVPVPPRWLHVGNSAAVLGGDALSRLRDICARFGLRAMARPGLALYGFAPAYSPQEPELAATLRQRLRPVLEWKTQVVSVRPVESGALVGYNGTFVATEPMRLALLAVGYADGLKRALSNRGCVLVRGQQAPIVGRISMDQTVVDVTEIPEVAPGDEVVLLGRQGTERIAAEDHARWAGTIPWEILTSIASRVERRQVGEQAMVGTAQPPRQDSSVHQAGQQSR